LHSAYEEHAVDTNEELEGIKGQDDELEKEVQQLVKNLANNEDIRDAVEDLTRTCNIVYHELKGAELAKTHEIGRVVSQVQWLTENTGTMATHFPGIRKELTSIKEDQQNILSQIQLIETQAKSTQDLLAGIDAKVQSLTDRYQASQGQFTSINMDLDQHTTVIDNMRKKSIRDKVEL
jgi:chromosome segregation ATPase